MSVKLTDSQRERIMQLLKERGLTFKPLLDEMCDHVTSDIEDQTASGILFDDALNATINELPQDHFKHIQNETMETINKRFNVSRLLSIATLTLLIAAALFKMMHLAGTGELFLIALGSLAASMTVSSLSGVFVNRDKSGAMRVISIVVGTIVMLAAVAFRVLHLPGGEQLIILGAFISIVALIVNTLYVYNHSSGHGNLMTFLHEKYSPEIERFLLILLTPFVGYRLIMLLTDPADYFANFILVVAIYGAGLQLIALVWRSIEQDTTTRTPLILFMVVGVIVTLTLPMLGEVLPWTIRIALIVAFSVFASAIVGRLDAQKGLVKAFVYLVPVLFAVLGAMRLEWIPSFANNIAINVIIIAIHIAGIFISNKTGLTRTLVIISLTSFLLETTAKL